MHHIFFTYSSAGGHLGRFLLLAIVNKTTVSMVEQVSLWEDGASYGYMPKSSIAESCGRSISEEQYY